MVNYTITNPLRAGGRTSHTVDEGTIYMVPVIETCSGRYDPAAWMVRVNAQELAGDALLQPIVSGDHITITPRKKEGAFISLFV